MPTHYLFLLLLLVIMLALALFPPTRSFIFSAYMRLRSRMFRHETVRLASAEPAARKPGTRPSWHERLSVLAYAKQILAGILIVLIALLVLWQIPRLLAPAQTDRFVLLIAPFRESDGTVSQTGRSVAAQLVDLLSQMGDRRLGVTLVDTPPDDTIAALRMMDGHSADAFIWGTITTGGMFDQESLKPVLAYRPNGVFAPAAWDGYAGRFEMPVFYTIAGTPINGKAVLPPLLSALVDYGDGRFDPAFETLNSLSTDYPAVAPALLHMLRGNMLWAQGKHDLASDEYQLATTTISDSGPQIAPLYNNLGAILQDANDPSASSAFTQAITLLKGQDLGVLRYNLGIAALHEGQPGTAVTSIEQAKRLLPPSTPLLLTLAEAYRANR